MASRKPSPKSVPKLSSEKLRVFRSKVAKLKKLGLIPGKSVDARSANPNTRRGGKTLADLVSKHRRKVSTPKPAQKAAPASDPALPLAPKDKPFYLRDVPGLKHRSLASVLRDIENNPDEIARLDAMKRPEERFAFEIEGTRSITVFPTIELLAEHFHYEGKLASFDVFHKQQKSRALFDKIKIVRYTGTLKDWRIVARERTERKRAKKKKENAKLKAAKRRKK